jgi:hypothetical protein
LDIAQSNYDYLDKLKSEIGLKGVSIIGKHPHWRLQFSTTPLLILIPQLLPYLRIKKEEAEITLQAAKLLHGGQGHSKTLRTEKLHQLQHQVRMLKPCNKYAKETLACQQS